MDYFAKLSSSVDTSDMTESEMANLSIWLAKKQIKDMEDNIKKRTKRVHRRERKLRRKYNGDSNSSHFESWSNHADNNNSCSRKRRNSSSSNHKTSSNKRAKTSCDSRPLVSIVSDFDLDLEQISSDEEDFGLVIDYSKKSSAKTSKVMPEVFKKPQGLPPMHRQTSTSVAECKKLEDQPKILAQYDNEEDDDVLYLHCEYDIEF